MTDSSELHTGMKVDDDLSSAMGIGIPADRDLISPGFDNAPRVGFRSLTIPVISSEYERVFSNAKKLLIPEKYPGRRYYRGNRVLKSLVGSRLYSTAGCLAWSDAEGFNSHLFAYASESRIVEEP